LICFAHPSKKAAFHFAAEEYIMRDLRPQDPVMMLWQTDDTVMIGANQIVDLEIDSAYAASRGIDIVRRSSGGGTIFTDPGTLLFTVILPYREDTDPKDVARSYLAAPVIAALQDLGAAATQEGRNDILLGGKKISGIAQYIRYGYLCSHGSLLFGADLETLARVLTADDEKIVSKALRSIRSRVTNIADHIERKDISLFADRLRARCHGEVRPIREDETAAIYGILREKYEDAGWTYGHSPACTFHNAHRFAGGRIEVFLQVETGRITSCRIAGDFLALRPVAPIEEALCGIRYEPGALREALSQVPVEDILGSLSKEELNAILRVDSQTAGLLI
jgi:lipoate-protein ligase A